MSIDYEGEFKMFCERAQRCAQNQSTAGKGQVHSSLAIGTALMYLAEQIKQLVEKTNENNT